MYFSLNRATAGGGLPLEQFVALAADAGFPAADVETGYALAHGVEALRDLYQSRKLRFGGWGLPVDWRSDAPKHAFDVDALRDHAKAAAALGIDSCSTWIMPSSDAPFSANWSFHITRLKPVATVLAEHGLRLGLEFVAPHHLRRKSPHEFIFTPGQMLELADDIGPNVGLLVDSFHCHTAPVTWEHLAQIPAQRIVLAHINDAPNVAVTAQEDGKRSLPGDGIIDLPGFLAALRQTGYAGPVSVEVFSADLKAMAPAEAAKKAWAACQRLG